MAPTWWRSSVYCPLLSQRYAPVDGNTLTWMLQVGGTSGIGEATARAFVRDTLSSRVYLVGRNETQGSKIIEELRQVNPEGEISFIKCDAARLQSVDEACKTIQEKEDKVNLLFLSAGMLTTKGRDGTRNSNSISSISPWMTSR